MGMSENVERSEVWSVEEERKVALYISDTIVGEYSELTADMIKQVARERGVKKFVVEDEWGSHLSPEDFPITAERTKKIVIKEYNEAK